jgi:hypothetical protein
MTYSVLDTWYSSSGDRRVITRRVAVTLAAEPLTLTATQLGFNKIWDVSNAISISGGALYPCGVSPTSGDDTIYGITTLPSTAGNLTGTFYLTVTGV